jgi:hypothetical protein
MPPTSGNAGRTSLQLAWLDEKLAAVAERCRAVTWVDGRLAALAECCHAVTAAVDAAEREAALWAVVGEARCLMMWRGEIESRLVNTPTEELEF